MNTQAILHTLVALGFTPTEELDGSVTLNEEVFLFNEEEAQDEVYQRYVEIRSKLREHGLDMPPGQTDFGHDTICGTVIPLES